MNTTTLDRPPTRTLTGAWPAILTAVLGASLALVAAGGSPPVFAFGAVSGLAVAAAPWIAARNRTAAQLVLLLGALPFAVVTWWTVLTPTLAVLAVATGLTAIRRHRTPARIA